MDDPTPEQIAATARQLITDAVQPIAGNPELREKLIDVRRSYEQVIDTASADRVISGEYSREAADRARSQTESFRQFIEDNKDEITAPAGALQPALRRRPDLRRHQGTGPSHRPPAPPLDTRERLWQAYKTLDASKVRGSGHRVNADLVSLVRHALGHADELVSYPRAG